MSKTKIILAENEPALAMIIKESLESRNFEVLVCKDGVEALETYHKTKVDVLVFDVMMPNKDGFTLAKEIRKIDNTTPIIFLTSKSQTVDVVEGFTIGGNDYLKKPFSMEELIVRIHSLLRFNTNSTSTNIELGAYQFDVLKQTLTINSNQQSLTHRESLLLELLVKNKNRMIERSEILQNVWGSDDYFSGRSMDVFITKLRKKLSEDPNIMIINSRGQGYKLIF